MATPPFSAAFITKLKSATAWRFHSQIGPVFTPRFFCCTDPNDLGIVGGKQPVAVLDLDPIPALVGDTVTFDGTDSYDPDGAVTAYAWTFPSGTPASSSDDTNTVTWAAPGEYEVQLIVTDGTGLKSSPARTVITIWEPTGSYYYATATGVFFTDDGGQTVTVKNTGLSGDALIVNDLKIDPATQEYDEDKKALWIATDGGVYASNDGGENWVIKNPTSVTNTWSDAPAPTVADLRFQKLLFANGVLYTIANWKNGDGDERSWAYYCGNFADIINDIDNPISWVEIDLGV
jgi:hypothetical protein